MHTSCDICVQRGACTLKVCVPLRACLSFHLHPNPTGKMCLGTSRSSIYLDVVAFMPNYLLGVCVISKTGTRVLI